MSDPNFPVIEGVRLLNTITNQLPDWAEVIIAISMILGICSAATTIGLWDEMSFDIRFCATTVSIILIIGAVLLVVFIYRPPIYQCIVDPSISYQKLTETFNVIEQHGEIIDLMLK